MKTKTRWIKRCAAFFMGVYLCTSTVIAGRTPDVRLENDQSVIVSQSIVGESQNMKRLGRSNIYITDAKTAHSRGVDAQPVLPYSLALTPDDPLEPQAYLNLLNAESAWDETTGDAAMTVAVIDSGYALDHEDMTDRWLINDGETGATTSEGATPNCTSQALPLDKNCNNLDDDGNGYVDDWRGWDFANGDNDPQAGTTDPNASFVEHGVEVSGLVGITGNNTTGAASLNWNAKIMPLQVFSDAGSATTIEVAEAISYAIDNGADIINMSFGSTATDSTIESLLESATEQGIILVAAAGNCGGSSYSLNGCDFEGQMLYPATSDYTIAVAATDLNDEYASFSSYGSTVDITAPGSGDMISSSYSSSNETNLYSDQLYGTSFSTPVTSGAMSLLKTVWPDAKPRELRAVLVDTAKKVSEMSDNLSTEEHGFGRIQPFDAVTLASACVAANQADINCDAAVNIVDLSLFANQWELERVGRTDIDLNGVVDIVDLSIFASNWGS